MSIYKAYKTPVALIRSFFIFIIMVILTLSTDSITCYANSIIFTQNIYHQHTGNSNGGGCYSERKTGTTTEEIPCGGSMVYFPAQDESKCDRCAASYHGDQSHRGCWHSETISKDYTYYDMGCNLDSSSVIGVFTVGKSTESWTKSLQLIASYQVQAGTTPSNPYIWNGGQATANNTYTVTQNGNYTVALNSNDNMTSAQTTIAVKNIDVTAPIIYSHTTEPKSGWIKEGVWVTLGKVDDLQPDGSKGSGLHEKPYSYDGGKTWTADVKHLYTVNGTYTIKVRDKLGNLSSYSVKINNIDNVAPVIHSHTMEPNSDWTKEGVLVTLGKVEDLQPDGSKGSGLHEKPYSYDGGKTWTADVKNFYTVNGTYTINVRDKLGNSSSYSVKINNIDNVAPVIHSHTMEPNSDWIKEGVLVTIGKVEDLQPDGSKGSGLHEKPYSYDGGETWTADTCISYTTNAVHEIKVRDKLGNIAGYNTTVHNIDETAPTIQAVEYDDTANIATTTINVEASDLQPDGSEGSGLHETPYSFDGGETWQEESTWIVDKNETVVVAVRDKLENIVFQEVSITNIDCFAPEISYEMIKDSWTNQDVKLYLSAQDMNEDGSEGAGLADEWYSLDGGNTWVNEEVQVYDKNQTITVIVRDCNNNQSSADIEITQIDKELPWVSLDMKTSGSEDNMTVIIMATAGDDESGLQEEGYSWDGGKTFGKEQTISVQQNGMYEVYVRDNAGNCNSKQIQVNTFPVNSDEKVVENIIPEETIVEEAEEIKEIKEPDKPVETKKEENTQEPAETKKEENIQKPAESKKEEVAPQPAEIKKEDITQEPVEVKKKEIMQEPVETKEEEVTQEPVEIKKEEKVIKQENRIEKPEDVEVKEIKSERNGWDWKDIIALICTLLFGILLLLLLLLFWLRTIAVYAENEHGDMQFVGRLWIHHKEERYEVYFSDFLLEQCVTTHFNLCPSRLFILLHKDTQLCCLFPEELCITLPLEKTMDLSLT